MAKRATPAPGTGTSKKRSPRARTGRSASSDGPSGSSETPATGLATGDERTVGGPSRSVRASGYRQRSYYLHDEVWARLRNTWWSTHAQPAAPSTQSDFVAVAVQMLCEILEGEYNDGEPFPAAPGAVPPGPSSVGASRLAAGMRDAWVRRAAGG